LLNAAGYRTGIIGKVHVQPQSVYPFGVEISKDLAGARDVVAVARRPAPSSPKPGTNPLPWSSVTPIRIGLRRDSPTSAPIPAWSRSASALIRSPFPLSCPITPTSAPIWPTITSRSAGSTRASG